MTICATGTEAPVATLLAAVHTGYTDNGDGTVTDASTGLMWSRADNADPDSWKAALADAQAANAKSLLGHDDWRLPNRTELQDIVDYTRSPDTTDSPAIDPMFDSTPITDAAGLADWGRVRSSTSHANGTLTRGNAGAYMCFGCATGDFDRVWTDVHGSDAQCSDFKVGVPADYPNGKDPQDDAQRVYHVVRLVREAGWGARAGFGRLDSSCQRRQTERARDRRSSHDHGALVRFIGRHP